MPAQRRIAAISGRITMLPPPDTLGLHTLDLRHADERDSSYERAAIRHYAAMILGHYIIFSMSLLDHGYADAIETRHDVIRGYLCLCHYYLFIFSPLR